MFANDELGCFRKTKNKHIVVKKILTCYILMLCFGSEIRVSQSMNHESFMLVCKHQEKSDPVLLMSALDIK